MVMLPVGYNGIDSYSKDRHYENFLLFDSIFFV